MGLFWHEKEGVSKSESGLRSARPQGGLRSVEILNRKAMHRSHLVKREAIEQKAWSLMSRK